ncbi:MAG: HEAT repeat domain-containing protein [Planctomycetes bacterium]|nr:HEAT repeat domain-containing protein [Planctomycetota bacterium]
MPRRALLSIGLSLLAVAVWIAVGSCRSPARNGTTRPAQVDPPAPRRSVADAVPAAPASRPDDAASSLPSAGEADWTVDEMLAKARTFRKIDVMVLVNAHNVSPEIEAPLAEQWHGWVEKHKGILTDGDVEKILLALRNAGENEIGALGNLLAQLMEERDRAEWERRGRKGRMQPHSGWSRIALTAESQVLLVKSLQEWGVWTKAEYEWGERDHFDRWSDYILSLRKLLVTEFLARSGFDPVAAWLVEHPERIKVWEFGGAGVVPALIERVRRAKDVEEGKTAREVLARVRDPEAGGLLRPLLRDPDHELRQAALRAISLQGVDIPIADLVLLLQEAETDRERVESIKAMGQSGNGAVGPMLLDLAQERLGALRAKRPKAPLSEDPVLMEACESLCRLRDPGAIDWWMRSLLQRGSASVPSAIEGVGVYRAITWLGFAHAEQARPLLDAILRNPAESEDMRSNARASLQMITGDMNYGNNVKIIQEQ